MKEEEAKTKWCPFARTGLLAGNGGVAVNRSVDMNPDGQHYIEHLTRCLGSACMAWRWHEYPQEPLPEKPATVTLEYVRTSGYCGLAGSGAP